MFQSPQHKKISADMLGLLRESSGNHTRVVDSRSWLIAFEPIGTGRTKSQRDAEIPERPLEARDFGANFKIGPVSARVVGVTAHRRLETGSDWWLVSSPVQANHLVSS